MTASTSPDRGHGRMEFDYPPSPPSSKLAPVEMTGAFFVAKLPDGELASLVFIFLIHYNNLPLAKAFLDAGLIVIFKSFDSKELRL